MARLLAIQGSAEVLIGIEREGAIQPVRARTLGSPGAEDVGCQVAVMFENGDPARPVVMGVVGPWPSPAGAAGPEPRGQSLEIDVERLLLSANEEIVFRCGKSSVTLTRAGKIILRGTYLSSRSSGVHRIRGGSVQVN
jgi:hypothetical protein